MRKPFIVALAAAALVTACQTDSRMDLADSRFHQLPINVRQTAQQQIGNAEILDIDQEQRTGSTVYEITYAGIDNNREKLHIREDGLVLSRAEAGMIRGEISEAAGSGRTGDHAQFQSSQATQLDARTDSAQVQLDSSIAPSAPLAEAQVNGLLVGTKFEDLPAAVQNTIQQYAPNAQIADIDKEERTGEVIYEVSFKQPGRNPKIHVAQDGRLVSESRANILRNEAAGAGRGEVQATPEFRGGEASQKEVASRPAARGDALLSVPTRTGGQAAPQADAANIAALQEPDIANEAAGAEPGPAPIEPAQVRFSTLPQPVQNAIRSHGGEAQVSEINRQTVYEVKFADGEQKLTIRSDGTIVE